MKYFDKPHKKLLLMQPIMIIYKTENKMLLSLRCLKQTMQDKHDLIEF